ncbi:MAG: hypothetical protein ACPL7D_10865 [Candidatus Sumerlaeaceae bacterium]|jgi:hypothetical protein
MRYEQKVWAPLWLELSGLPFFLAEKARTPVAWSIFKKIVELDCALNPVPGIVQISLDDLAKRCGAKADIVRRTMKALQKLGILACFLPETDEEEAFFQVKTPLHTPLSPDEVRGHHPELFAAEGHYFRYAQATEGSEYDDSEDVLLKEVVDLYLNAIGLKLNAFVLDELRLIRQRFPIDLIRQTFRRAAKNDIHSLGWVMKELIRQKRKLDEEKGEDAESLPEM